MPSHVNPYRTTNSHLSGGAPRALLSCHTIIFTSCMIHTLTATVQLYADLHRATFQNAEAAAAADFVRMPYAGGYKEEDDDLDNDGEEEEGGEMKSANDHCILLIDARPNMFEVVNDDGDVR